MLPDTERKTITILHNFSTMNKRMPVWHELERKTGRRSAAIVRDINALQEKRLLEWDGKATESIKIIPGWHYLI